MSKKTNKYTHIAKLRYSDGALAFGLDCFGDFIAKREKYKQQQGIDAVYFYLIQKHHWLPSQVRAMSWNDLLFVLAEEMSGWTWPEDAGEAWAGAHKPV